VKKVDQIIIEKISEDSLTYGLYERKKKHIELIECIGESFDLVLEVIKEILNQKKSLPGKQEKTLETLSGRSLSFSLHSYFSHSTR